jgi:hypothetical protein
MFLKSKRTSRSVDYLLAALSPLEVARATHAYLATLPEEELQGLIARSVARMDEDERAYFEMSHDFGTFLEQNRRALRTLDHDALRAILMPVIAKRAATVEGTEDDSLRIDDLASQLRASLPPVSTGEALRRLTTPAIDSYRKTTTSAAERRERLRRAFFAADAALERAYRSAWVATLRATAAAAVALAIAASGAIVAAAIIFFLIPAGKDAMSWIGAHPSIVAHTKPATRVAVHHQIVHHAAVHHAALHHAVPIKIVVAAHTPPPSTPAPTATPVATPKVTPTPAPTVTPKAVHIAVTKPETYAAASAERNTLLRRIAAKRVLTGTMPSHEAPLVQRARLIVMSYLDSLMRGDASSALGNLGLSASAGTSNLTEAPILAGATEFRVVRAALADASSAKVQVVIDSPQGRYFGDYIVSANGPAAWITQHEVIPVQSASHHL